MSQGLFVTYIKRRIARNKNFLGCFVGETGSGKSYAALKLAEAIDRSFTVKRVAFNTIDFLKIVNKCKSGQVVVFDEMGTDKGSGNREWNTRTNKVLNYITQIFRHKNLIIFYTVPDITFIDKQQRKLFHMLFITAGIDTKRKLVKLKPLIVSPARTFDKTYHIYPNIHHKELGLVKLKRLAVGMPSEKLVSDYETVRSAFTKSYYSEVEAEFQQDILGDKKRSLKDRQRNALVLLQNTKFSNSKIARQLGCASTTLNKDIRLLKDAGYKILPAKERVIVG
jgi:biotin operon repressor